jgi:hypothetical protein
LTLRALLFQPAMTRPAGHAVVHSAKLRRGKRLFLPSGALLHPCFTNKPLISNGKFLWLFFDHPDRQAGFALFAA